MTRLLVASHSQIINQQSRILLEAKGYKLIYCVNLQQSLAIILDHPPDLLIVEKDFDGGKDKELIKAAKTYLQKSYISILLVADETVCSTLNWTDYPIDELVILPLTPEQLITRIQLAESRIARVFDNNPLTKLPGNTSIIKTIQNTIDSETETGVCYLDIDNFKPYNDRYGFVLGDDVILVVARIIVNVVDEMARGESFIGHIGGDDFVFLVPEDKIEQVCKKILSNFAVVRNMLISPQDIKAGGYNSKDRQGRETYFGLLSVSIAAVTIKKKKFKHYGEIAAVASQLKHQVKKSGGGSYMIDRRKMYFPT